VLELIAADKYHATPQRPDASLERLKSQVAAYRIGDIERVASSPSFRGASAAIKLTPLASIFR